ncbi:MAG TPA: glucose 1-dehydrogenase [Pseudolabrys sp.]|uniref:glucose 1-dehydrogenase n=1 Tax=Pseudolabrys sp. TaxID=1960880 RepID=UPI002DDCB31C|nr:glucose 1-dehydrogenase [Pseudolabrys sp.]HEV2628363.1 glucose 1-dehydrogenase [Pseudolabrys sp.]
MRALTVKPGTPNSIQLDAVAPPPESDGSVLVRALALGICGTDREIVAGDYGWAPEGQDRLILGHESLGRVEAAPDDCGFAKGDLVAGIVRRPDPVPCPACAAGVWDMCRNGQYTERGIKERNGYGSEYFRVEPDFLLKLDPSLDILGVLMEPTSVVAKAWDHVLRIGDRARAWTPRNALVTGAGPVGLLAAMIGAQRGLEMHVLDRNTEGPKPKLVKALGATFHTSLDGLCPDIVIECTGAPTVILDVMGRTAPDGIVCLAGVSSGGRKLPFDIGDLNRAMVLENRVVFGSVNANRDHYAAAAEALAKADRKWLAGLITRRVPLERWQEALERRDDDIKVVLDFTA